MTTKPKAAKTATAKKPAAKEASRSRAERKGQASRSSGADAPDADGLEWAEIERMWDVTPQELWGVDQWRRVALYLSGAYQRVVAQLGEANKSHEQATALLRGVIEDYKKASLHTRALRFIESELHAGRMSITTKVPRKKPGAPKKLSPEKEQALRSALIVLAARHAPAQAAKMMARAQLKREGIDPNSRRGVAKMDGYTKTWANKVAPAKRLVAKQISDEFGDSDTARDLLAKLKLLDGRRIAKSPKKA